jgi:molybdopterin-containing oxidoreductase family iron-sulfur binding subunit
MEKTTSSDQAAQKPFYVKGREQLEGSPEYTQWVGDEFPHRRSIPDISRRDILKLVGGSIALAGLASGCRFLPEKKIVPFVVQPEDAVTGIARHFASSFSLSGYAQGILVESHEGRPTKIEGSPLHWASLGSVSAFGLAEVFNLYDPDRTKSPSYKGDPSNWEDFLIEIRKVLAESGEGLVVMTETVGSPTLASSIQKLVTEMKGAWIQYEPVNRDNRREGAIRAFGQDVEAVYHFDKAKVIVSLDSDFMQFGPAPVRYARDLMSGRRVEESEEMNRIYALECFPTLTGAVADHRVPVKATQIAALAAWIAAQVGVAGASGSLPSAVDPKIANALVEDLKAAGGDAIVIAGDHQSAEVHALVHLINQQLGSNGKTIRLTNPVHPVPVNQMAEIKKAADLLERGAAKTLVILGGNPVFTAPVDLKLGELIEKAPFSAYLGSHINETAKLCHWILPESHLLEAWGDAVAVDGTISIVQPLIEPIYDSKSALELVDALRNKSRTGLDVLKAEWSSKQTSLTGYGTAKAPIPASGEPLVESNFDRAWRFALSEGILVKGQEIHLPMTPVANAAAALSAAPAPTDMELVFLPDPTLYDGRYANNPWLQELPKPITNFTWDNCYFVGAETALKLNLERKEVLGTKEIEQSRLGLGRPMAVGTTPAGSLKAATATQMGQAEGVVVIHFGGGRTEGGEFVRAADIKKGGGFNAFALRSSTAPWIQPGVKLERSPDYYPLANVQFHNALETQVFDSDRHVIQEASLASFIAGGALAHHKEFHVKGAPHHDEGHSEGGSAHDAEGGDGHASAKKQPLPDMYDPKEFDFSKEHYQWAMTIDLNLCTGCGACVMACQSENNIPTVGKEQVQKGREMHWIRIDRYYMGQDGKLNESNPPIRFQPVTCMHCENAPCEPVCPVAATVHSHEGLNQMVYNRCVGTRYCSNNCPYKVRRYNFLHYTLKNDQIPVLQMVNNPDVTVRGRGVMEKCTYCVQRINKARISAKKSDREIEDGEVVTACQSACPTKAIVFGDMRRPENAVAKTRESRRNYLLLEEANTKPRTTYLMRVNNPHPSLAPAEEEKH